MSIERNDHAVESGPPCWNVLDCLSASLAEVVTELLSGLLSFTKIEAFKFSVAILKKQFFLPDGSVSMLTDNNIGNPLSF